MKERIELLERRLSAMQRRRARWIGVLVAAVPLLSWAYDKPHPDFEPGTPISSADVNETVDDVYFALNTLDLENGRVTAQTALDTASVLPVSGSFTSQGGAVLLFVSGSAYRQGAGGIVGVNVVVDGTPVGTTRVFTNEVGSHKSLVSHPFVLDDLAAGMHDVDLTALAGTSSDGNDFWVVTALELPR